jgi:predicted dehydrogenase/threonine dehydrogenase-like Zn-dependent dehydrogenase
LKQLIIGNGGKITNIDLPDPGYNEIGVLCQSKFSCISSGTETAGIIESRKGLLKNILETENLIPTIINNIKEGRFFNTILKRESEPISPFLNIPGGFGYSSSGIIIKKGREVNNFKLGDRIACAGSPHSTIMYAPRTLFVKIPQNVSFEDASFVALGAISMHAVRRAKPEFGDTFTVIGMGVIGQITAQLLKNIGCKVIVTDIFDERLKLAENLGADKCLNVLKQDPLKIVNEFTNGLGSDGVIVCAGSSSPQPLIKAFEITRDKGRVVLVGAVPINFPRSEIYNKEIDFFISRSYGPGRYEENYEGKGLDYPIEKIRWTENRNMEEFLRLISKAKIDVKSLITHIYPFNEANKAYDIIIEKPKNSLGVLLSYEKVKEVLSAKPLFIEKEKLKKLNVGVIGSGGFARGTLIPILRDFKNVNLEYVAAKTKKSVMSAKEEFGFKKATINYKDILEDYKIDFVIICTRHNLHYQIVMDALENNKQVFVEKPMGLTVDECKKIVEKVKTTNMKLFVGFNRRFSPLSIKVKNIIKNRKNPIMINYRVVAGFTPANHWIYDPIEGGGRIIGEVCHFIDLLCWLIDANPTKIYSEGGNLSHKGTNLYDNIIVNMKFPDDSIASLIYGDMGDPSYPKERIEIFAGNVTIIIDDFKELIVKGVNQPNIKLPEVDKGYKKELIEFLKSIQNNSDTLVTAVDGFRATFLSYKIIESLQTGKPILIKGDFFER